MVQGSARPFFFAAYETLTLADPGSGCDLGGGSGFIAQPTAYHTYSFA
jgi:hypothetical protein